MSALDGLAERQRVTAQNVANVNTPHYLAKKVSFESALAKSVAAGDGTAKLTNSYSLDETKLNGNNVNLDTETLTNVETVLRYQFAIPRGRPRVLHGPHGAEDELTWTPSRSPAPR